jgi:lipoprotein-anchoring transpeptidase ErfK/SrfK
MLKRTPVSAALAGLALAGALSACGSATGHGASAGAASASTISTTKSSAAGPELPAGSGARAPIILVVRLGTGFNPGTLRISPGQHFVISVDSSVKASSPAVPSSCSGATTRIDAGMLTVRCASGAFYYTAERAGTVELIATVRPRCVRGRMCPQWMTEAKLKITIR